MKNQEMKKPIPVEVNEDELNIAAGSENVIISIARGPLSEPVPCRVCGKRLYSFDEVCICHGVAFCRDCYEKTVAGK